MKPKYVGIRSTLACSLIACSVFLPIFTGTVDSASKLSADDILNLEGDIDFGEYLAGECLTCHLADQSKNSIPVIHGKSAEYLVTAILEYRRKERANETMQSVANNLNKEEIAALVAYFSAAK